MQPTASPGEHPDLSAANARSGLFLFFIYLAFYAGFMGLAAFAPQSMGMPVLGGVNLAITYGMGLIFGAFVIAAIYMVLCGRNARALGGPGLGEREASASRLRSDTGRLTPTARQEDAP